MYTLDKSKMKNKMGVPLTRGLFKEYNYGDQDATPVFTFKEEDDGEFYSFKKLYVSIGDPTEYQQALQMLGNWTHWQKLCNSSQEIKKLVEECRQELNIKLKSAAYEQIKSEALYAEKEATRLAAARFLAKEGIDVDSESKKKRGRPSKEELQGNLAQATRDKKQLEEDFDRITIN